MDIVWDRGEATARDVQDSLEESRPVAYTTAQTMLRVLQEKGYLRGEKAGRAVRYVPLVSRTKAQRDALKHLILGLFGGSPEALAMHLVREGDIDTETIARLEQEIAKSKEQTPPKSRKR